MASIKRFGGRTAWARGAVLLLAVPFCSGCPSLTVLPTQAPIREMTETRTGRPYLLYVPSTYGDQHDWPLVIACHGTPPWDKAEWQMQEWARFAEDHGIIVAAPKLQGTRGDFPPAPEEQIALQRADEDAILGVVAGLQRDYRIAPSEIFMTGWSAAAYAILHTGLRHPDVFRALAIREGTFDGRFMDVRDDQLDRYQPIKIILGQHDFLRVQSEASVAWLKARGMFVQTLEITGSHRRIDPETPWKFFREVVRERPWIRIRVRVLDLSDPMTVRLSVDSVPPLTAVRWVLGDGAESDETTLSHTYERPGRYEVKAQVTLHGGRKFWRKRMISVGMSG